MGSYFKAIELLFTSWLWLYFAFPLALNILLFWGGYALVAGLSDVLFTWLSEIIGFSSNPDESWIPLVLYWFIWVVFKILYFLMFAFIGGYIVLILLSPVLAYLSEKTEKILSGKTYPFDIEQLMRDMARGILISIRNMLYQTFFTILTFMAGFIPIVGFFMPFLMFFIASYYYGFSFIDYSLERRKLSISQSVLYMKKRKGLAISNGMVFALFMLIPYCGVSLAGFAAIVSVVASAIAIHKTDSSSK